MSLPKRIAFTLPAGFRLKDTIDRVKWAEENGITDVWFSDTGILDPLIAAAALAPETKSIRIGVAVTPVFTRTPATFAATLGTLAQLLPGRFVMGMGSSSPAMVEGWHGQKFEKPLTRVKETAQLVRSMLAGEKTAFDGETVRSHGFRMFPLQQPLPLYLAALRPNMIEMATQVGDGVIFNLWPKGALPKMIDHVRKAADKAGKSFEDVEVVNRYMIAVTDDKPAAREAFRKTYAPYFATPVYNKFLAWAGYDEAAATIREGWAEKNRDKTTGALTDAIVDEIAVIGSADECRERIRENADTGVHTAILQPMAGTDNATFEAFLPKNFSF
jgi:probable F420-dependent oxidoreductase